MFMFLLLFFSPFLFMFIYLLFGCHGAHVEVNLSLHLVSLGVQASRQAWRETGAFACCGVSLPEHTENPLHSEGHLNSSCL